MMQYQIYTQDGGSAVFSFYKCETQRCWRWDMIWTNLKCTFECASNRSPELAYHTTNNSASRYVTPITQQPLSHSLLHSQAILDLAMWSFEVLVATKAYLAPSSLKMSTVVLMGVFVSLLQPYFNIWLNSIHTSWIVVCYCLWNVLYCNV